MNVNFYATKIQAAVLNRRLDIERDYERYPDTTRFWCIIDLVASSNYRLLKGPSPGYVRGELFFNIINETITPASEIEMIKELGDAALLSAPSLRPLLESVLIVDEVSATMSSLDSNEIYPFGIRAGIGYGPVKRLNRPRNQQDYLGSPLDQLARLLGVRDPNSNILISEAAYRSQEGIVGEYSDFLSVGELKQLSSKDSKEMLKAIYYRELVVDRHRMRDFRNHFHSWRAGK